jgi:hypothetical protein
MLQLMMNDIQRVSIGGKIVMAFGTFLVLGAIFIMSNPLIGFVVLIMGFVAIIRGYGMKQGPLTPVSSTGTPSKSHYDTGLSSKKDKTSKGVECEEIDKEEIILL